MPILEIKNLTHTYGIGTPFQRSAVEDVSFDVHEGEFLGIIGHTGSGKSTLIQHLNGLLRPTSGQVFLEGKDIWSEPKKIRNVRFQVGLVFQYPEYQLFEETVYKDIAFGPINQGKAGDELDHCIREAARLVGIRDEQLNKSPFELSGGQKRRVALAGVLAMEPKVLVLDEPTAGLDPSERIRFRNLISELASDRIVLLSTHIVSDVESAASQIILMKDGKFLVTGTAEELIASCPDRSWICDVPKGEVLACHQKYRVANVKTLADHAQLRILSKDSPMPGAVQEEASLEDVFLSYFGERSGDGNGMV